MPDYPDQGSPVDPSDHSASNIPDATDHHDGTVLSWPNPRNLLHTDLKTQEENTDREEVAKGTKPWPKK